jgi:hypothetical protein
MSRGIARGLLTLAAAMAATAIGVGSAAAAAPAPYDAQGSPLAQPVIGTTALLTGLFGLGTVDLSTIGVSDSDLAGIGISSSTSSPTADNMLIVDDAVPDCPNAQFHSIQAAVSAAAPGAMIKVCPGTYVEQVTIPAGKDGITLFSEGDLQAIIKAPPVMTSPKAIVRIEGAHDVTIRHFTITGPGGGPCDSLEYGVRVDTGGSATITDNHITKIRDTPFSGCQNGVGVIVGRNFQNTSGAGSVVHNLIDDYQKGGVVVDGQLAPATPSSHADVAWNEIVGIGPTAVIAQNGIQVSRGAFADVHHNKVYGNVYSGSDAADEAILLYQVSSSQVRVHHNDVYDNNDGIGLYTTQNAEVGYNRSHDNLPYDGIFADTDTSNNTIEHNKLFGNGIDCDDESAGPYNPPAIVANPWIQDLGYTENRPGLCKHATP